MYMAVKNFIDLYSTTLLSIDGMVDVIKTLNALFDQVNCTYRLQQGQVSNPHDTCFEKEAELIQNTVQLSAALSLYAQTTRRPNLEALAKVSASALDRMTDTELLARCKHVFVLAKGLEDELVTYGVTAGTLKSVETSLECFKSLSNTNNPLATRSQVTGILREQIIQMDQFLTNKVDPMMAALEKRDLPAYRSYLAARAIAEIKPCKQKIEATAES